METENYTNQTKVLQLITWSFLTGNMSNMPKDFFAQRDAFAKNIFAQKVTFARRVNFAQE